MLKSFFKSKITHKNKYSQLLIVLISNFILSPFLRGNIGGIIISLAFLYAIILIVKTFSLKVKFFDFIRVSPAQHLR